MNTNRLLQNLVFKTLYTLQTKHLNSLRTLKQTNKQTNFLPPLFWLQPGTFIHRFIPLGPLKWFTHTGNLWLSCVRLTWMAFLVQLRSGLAHLLIIEAPFPLCFPCPFLLPVCLHQQTSYVNFPLLLNSVSVLSFPPHFFPFPR